MLIGFKVSNYKSLRDEQELSMPPSRGGKDFTALPVAAIYGANASGKSSLVKALSFKDHLTKRRQKDTGLCRPFLLDKESADRPTAYGIEDETDGIRYEYHLSVSIRGVERERLHSCPQHRKRTLLDRTGETITIGASMTNRTALQALSTETPTDTPAFCMADSYKATERLKPGACSTKTTIAMVASSNARSAQRESRYDSQSHAPASSCGCCFVSSTADRT